MSQDDPDVPVAEDDFPEFAEPPRHRPAIGSEPEDRDRKGQVDAHQAGVDEVLERLRRERADGQR